MKERLVALAGSWVIKVLGGSLRKRHIGAEVIESAPRSIIAFWHGHLAMMLHSRYPKPMYVLLSKSKDGELMAQTFAHFGVDSVRGSSSRGGSGAMRELIRITRAGANIAVTPDGPRGPARVAKDGVVFAARATGLPIIPIAVAFKKKSCCAPGIA